MKKIFFFALMVLAASACSENYADEQMEVRKLMNKSCKNKTEKVKDPFARGKDKNADIMPISQSVTGPWKPFPIRHPTEE